MKPEWNKASLKLKDKVKFVQYDADANKGKSADYSIKGFPTLFWFDKNTNKDRSKSSAKEYNGGRSEQDLINWINNQLTKDVNLDVQIYEV